MKQYKLKINGNNYDVAVNNIENGIADVSVNGTNYKVEVDGHQSAATNNSAPVRTNSTQAAASAQPSTSASTSGGSPLKSPLPGVLLDVKVREGDSVQQGQCLMILEAMKMENNIDAHKSGIVKNITKRTGDSVLEGDTLLTIE